MWRQAKGIAFGNRTLWLAALPAALWAPDVEAYDAGRRSEATGRLAQTVTVTQPEPQAGEAQDHLNELLLKLLNNARDEQARAKQAADREAAELRKAL
jgi:hypothetical protein